MKCGERTANLGGRIAGLDERVTYVVADTALRVANVYLIFLIVGCGTMWCDDLRIEEVVQ